MKVISEHKLPVKMWIENIEEGALKQIANLANLPFAYKHIAIMPDCHQGYGMPIGGVLATQGVIIPNAVGGDIGCGMSALKTGLKELSLENLKKIMGLIREKVPVGFKHQEKAQDANLMPYVPEGDCTLTKYPIMTQQYESARKQLGTLGGGNHFIEIQRDQEGYIWIMIHSGSRNLGKKVCDYYNEIAKELNTKWFSSVTKEQDLAFLPIGTKEAECYLREMRYCLDFALANRNLMMMNIVNIVNDVTGNTKEDWWDVHHNYVAPENHFGKNVWVHRKGATSARLGEIGIIPGSQGTKSYIVLGKGNVDSFNSCSHGAGRKMGRKEAERTLNLADEIKRLDDQGILHSIRGNSDLDEASGAYKDISDVMHQQEELVQILTELTPLGVVKG